MLAGEYRFCAVSFDDAAKSERLPAIVTFSYF
jgi:hypothetical protein